MKCLLCKGKGSFYVYKKSKEFDVLLGGTEYYMHEDCPRCNGTGTEKYIHSYRERIRSLIKDYSSYYKKYFITKKIKPQHEAILKLI